MTDAAAPQTPPNSPKNEVDTAEEGKVHRVHPSFGRRTDSHTGISLGLAPVGLQKPGQTSDDSAPDGLLDEVIGEDAGSIVTEIPEPLPPKEHPAARAARLAAEEFKRNKAAEDAAKAQAQDPFDPEAEGKKAALLARKSAAITGFESPISDAQPSTTVLTLENDDADAPEGDGESDSGGDGQVPETD